MVAAVLFGTFASSGVHTAPPLEASSNGALAWPFDLGQGPWVIENGYAGAVDHGCPPTYVETCATAYELYSFDFQVNSGSTAGKDILAPASGNELQFGAASGGGQCVSIAIGNQSGYHVLVCHLAAPGPQGTVTIGQKIGTVDATANHIHITLYYDTTPSQTSRTAVPFSDPWQINGCNFPPDGTVDPITKAYNGTRGGQGQYASSTPLGVCNSDTTPPLTVASLSGALGDNGWFTSDVWVSLSATDSQSGVASMWSKIDSQGWSLYSGPFGVAGQGSHTLSYYSRDNAGNQEPTKTVMFKIDSGAPSGSMLLNNGSAQSSGAALTIDSSVSDAISGMGWERFSNDGATWSGWQPYQPTGSWTIPVVNGASATVYAQYKDIAGNVSSTLSQSITPVVNIGPSSSANYRLVKGVTSTAGGVAVSSGGYRMSGAAGQPAPVGRVSSSHFAITSGFFTALAQAPPIPISVGGIAEQPDVAAPPATQSTSADRSARYVLGGSIALAVLFAAGASAWHVRRRRAR